MKERLEEKFSSQKLNHDMEKLLEPSLQQQKEIIKAITTGNEYLGKAILQKVEKYNQTTQRNSEIISNLIKSNAIESSITTTLVLLMNSSNKNHISVTHLNGFRFSMN